MYPQLTSSIIVARWLRASSWLESQGTQNQTQSGPSLFLPYPVTFGTVPNPETDRLTPARGKTIRRYHLMGKECDPQTGLITGTRLLSWYWAPCNRFSGPRFESRTGPYTFVIMLMHHGSFNYGCDWCWLCICMVNSSWVHKSNSLAEPNLTWYYMSIGLFHNVLN